MASSPLAFDVVIDASGPLELFENILPQEMNAAMKIGAAKAAIQVQDLMRDELDRLVYSTPESPSYQRTYTLWRATYASRPGTNHSNDHEAAAAGVDLAQTSPGVSGGGLVTVKNFVAEIEVGSYANWAWYVHEGLGSNASRGPRPFSEMPVARAPDILESEIGQAIADSLAAILK